MADKITPDDLQKVLTNHLKGTALEPLIGLKNLTDLDGFVIAKYIDRLCNACQQTINIYKMPNSGDKKLQKVEIAKLQKAIEALERFKTNVKPQ